MKKLSLEKKMANKAVSAAERQPDLEYRDKIVLPLLGKSFYLNSDSQVKSNGPAQLVIPEKHQESELTEYPLAFGDKIISCAPGLAVILGGTGSGKTTILDRAIATGLGESAVDYQRLLHLEDGPLHETMSATDQTFFYQLLSFLSQKEEKIILVDSISEWFTRSEGGNTGKGGVNTRIPFDLRVLNYAAMRTGKLVIAALNPGDREPEVIASLVNDLAASVRLVVHIVNEREVAFTTAPRRLELYYRYGDAARTIMDTMIDLSKAKRDESVPKADEAKDDVIVLDLESENETTLASLVRLLKGNE